MAEPSFLAIDVTDVGATCRRCGREITWVRTLAGRVMPCEAWSKLDPIVQTKHAIEVFWVRPSKGEPRVFRRSDEAHAFARRKGAAVRPTIVRAFDVPSALSHFANCKP